MLFIQEQAPPFTFVSTLSPMDLDFGQALTCYALAGDPDFAVFPNCSIYALVTLDGYVGARIRNTSVLVGDNGTPPLNSSSLLLNITILVYNQAPVSTTIGSISVIDTSPVGVSVLNLTATDREGDPNVFTILQGNRCRFQNSDVFRLNSSTGALAVTDKRALDYKYCTVMALTILIQNAPRVNDPRVPPSVQVVLRILVIRGVSFFSNRYHASST